MHHTSTYVDMIASVKNLTDTAPHRHLVFKFVFLISCEVLHYRNSHLGGCHGKQV